MKVSLLLLVTTTLCTAITCDVPALAVESIDDILRPGLWLGSQELWEMQGCPRTDADDQRPWHGCLVRDHNTETAGAEIHRANNLAGSRHFDEAIQQLSDAIERLPLDFRLRLSRAKIYIKVGQYDRAREDLRVAATKGSFDRYVEFEIEKLLVKLGEFQLAARTIPAILSKIPMGMGPTAKAQFQYLLAYSMFHGATRVARLCLLPRTSQCNCIEP